ncbi:Uncharacterised protein [Mycobacterium tuberculosis]|nr:Uncharacterised protein [Mycobacterium tuberculosis]
MDQRFWTQIIISRLVIIRRSAGEPCFTHPLVGHQMLSLATRDLIANLGRRLLLVKIQLAHRTHAVFVVINGLGFCRTIGAS